MKNKRCAGTNEPVKLLNDSPINPPFLPPIPILFPVYTGILIWQHNQLRWECSLNTTDVHMCMWCKSIREALMFKDPAFGWNIQK